MSQLDDSPHNTNIDPPNIHPSTTTSPHPSISIPLSSTLTPLISAHISAHNPSISTYTEYIKEPCNTQDVLTFWYSDAAAFFGYTVLFTSALPAAPAFAFLDKWIAVRLDAYQLLKQYRRPLPKGCEDIGTWQTVFEILSTIGVVTNAALIVFTMKVLILPGWTNYGRMWIFIGFQWILFLLQYIVSVAVPDVPEVVTIQQVCCKYVLLLKL